MSNRYKGGVLSATPPTTSSSAAPGIWTLEQQMQATAGTGWPFGGPFTYIEDVFSTWLYTGNSPSTQSIVNGIDLATYGGMVWCKSRVSGDGSTYNNILMDTARGTGSGNILYGNLTLAAQTAANAGISSFNSNGFSLRYDDGYGTNYPSGGTFASWTFREQAKFFDVVTYTGNGATRTIAHNLGSTPGCIIVKRLDAGSAWTTYHSAIGASQSLYLNSNDAATADTFSWNSTAPTSSVFTVGSTDDVNRNTSTYVAYLFASNAGGFGLNGTDNVITCGSVTGSAVVNLGYEPQWVLSKCAGSAGQDWTIVDNMRGAPVPSSGNTPYSNNLMPNLSNAENTSGANGASVIFNATGFRLNPNTTVAVQYIYIAIRRGPMKVPTSGTSVFTPVARSGTSGTATITAGFAPDVIWSQIRNYSQDDGTFDKLRGAVNLRKSSTGAEYAAANAVTAYTNTGVTVGADSDTGAINSSGGNYGNWIFQRAPSFFDEVCYTGTGSATTFSHNLGVAPEMMIVKNRVTGTNWAVYTSALGATKTLFLNLTNDPSTITSIWNDTAPTSSVFTVGSAAATNTSSNTYVAYLFATCAGVSKVGSYTGTATTKQIDCGFTAGARFVLIKRTDSTGDWYVYDSARGIVSGNDPYLLLNSTAAEVTGTDYVDTYNAGFELSSTAPAGLNANGGTYIFLAIA